MTHNGAMRLHRALAFLLTAAMLLTTCFTPAYAADLWKETVINLTWTDGRGDLQTFPAEPVEDSEQRAYWVKVDANALDQDLTLEVQCPDPAYSFYLLDEWGGQLTTFTWQWEMDAAELKEEYAYQLWYSVDGSQAQEPILLYVSSIDMPEEAPFEPFPVSVPVYYVTEDGETLDVRYVECWAGETTTIRPDSGSTADYALTGSDWVEVYVDENGVAMPGEVTFTYAPLATPTPDPTEAPTPTPVPEVSVPVVYMHVNGQQLDFQEVFYTPGTYVVTANSDMVAGYQPVGETAVEITVYPDGTVSVGSVVFTYEDIYVAPAEAEITVYYYHEDGTLLDQETRTLQEGFHTIMPNSDLVSGYELLAPQSVDVTVYADGSADVSSVVFTYKDVYVAPAEAEITVYYYHEDGTLLDEETRTLQEGTHTITPNSDKVGGYELLAPQSVDVTVYADGSTDVSSVVFTYKDVYVAPAEAEITVYYYHEDGTLLDEETRTLQEGTHTITPNSDKVGGYELLAPQSVDVTVYADGSADVSSVVFTYKDIYVAPAEAEITVYYYHEDGTLLDEETRTLQEGTHTITPNSDKVGGYELLAPQSVDVTVYADGSADVSSVVFTYKDIYVAPVEAEITVYYYHEDGTLLDEETRTLQEGTHTITPNSDKVSGFELLAPQSVDVTVYADGSADVSSVVFTYKDIYVAPVEAELTILYQTEDQTVIASDSKLLTPGEYTIRPDGTLIGSYVLSGEQSHVVYVDAQGGIAPGNTVVFTVHQPEVTVLVHYQDELGRSVAPDQSHTYTADGTYTITANPEGLAENYELAPGLHSTVTVTVIDGMASQSDVYFYYQQKQVAPTMANVTVHYYDTEGNEIADAQTVSLEAGKEHWLKAEPVNLPEGYELVSEETILVEVYENGTFSPQEIGFYYRPIQQEAVKADVIVRYCDDRGEEIATSQTHSLEDGTHIIEARPDDLPEGYVIFEGTESAVEVVVRNGVPTKSQVVFYYQYQAPVEEVVEFVLPVYYYDTEGNEIAESQTVKAAPGTYSIRANPVDLPEGSELRMDETLTVTVFDDGTTEPEEIAFYYYVPDKKATIIVSYVDDSGQAIIDPFTEELDAGSHTIGADPDRLPEGYDPDSAEPVQVYVSKNGEASPNQVTLSFERLVVEAPIPVGENVYRYAVVNDNDVAFRSEPSTAKGRETVIKRIDRNSKVYVLQELYNDKNEVWAMVNINGQEGYMMSEFLDMMTQQESDAYAAAFTPAPTFTPVPTASPTPTATPTGTPTATPTATPTTAPTDPLVEEVTAPPTATPTLEPLPEDEPTDAPTDEPTATPTGTPTDAPTDEPTATPTETPTDAPTDEPTATPTEMPTDAPTDEPTATPTETPTDEPTATPTITPAPYAGYALTTRSTALRTGISASDMTIIQILEANELVKVADQMTDPATGELWSIVSTMNNQPGYVQDASLRYISDKEAQAYLALWEEQNQSPEPSEYASPSAEPMQLQGYGVVLGDDVPFRQMASEFSRIIDNLSAETYVYITGQTYVDGTAWHSVNYEGHWGYIRADLVRMLTLTEEEEYLAQLNASPSPDPETTNQPFDANGLSSYGYVECSDNSSVNWRETPSTNGKRIGELKRYALCLVLSSEQVNGVTWYKINYGDKTGYIHGDFFKQMTITELENFLGSDEYFQGVTNNSPAGDTGMDDVGFTGTGGIVSREDQWVNNNPDVYASFAPFNPIATVAPIGTATPTLEPLPGQATDAPTESPTPTFNPLPDVTYPTTDEGSGGSGIIWAVVIGLLLLTVGGVFALVRYQQNKRRIAMRAAQRRAQAARAQQQRPYARTTASAQPRTGTYPNQQTAVRQPVTRSAEEAPAQYTPYTGTSAYGTGNAFRPAETSANEEAVQENAQQPTTQRVGRRTAYRRAQEAAGRNQENNDLKM